MKRLGDEPTVFEPRHRLRVWMELWALWFGVLITYSRIVMAYNSFGIHEIILGVVPLLFIYAPVWISQFRKVDSYAYRLYVPGFSDTKAWRRLV